MDKDKAHEVAAKITTLSVSLLEIALQSSNIILALHVIQDSIKESADIVTDIIKELPPEVRERLRVMKVGDIGVDKDSGKFVDWIRRMLKDGGTN